MIALAELYPSEVDSHEDVVPALRQLLSIHPSAVSDEPSVTARELGLRDLTGRQPSQGEVGAGLAALCVEGEVLA